MIADRAHDAARTFVIREDDGQHWRSFTFRDVLALLGAREGRVESRIRRRYAYGMVDEYLEPECDFYGIGYGTLSGLQRNDWKWEPLLARCGDEPGQLPLTELGDQILDLILALPGVSFQAVVA